MSDEQTPNDNREPASSNPPPSPVRTVQVNADALEALQKKFDDQEKTIAMLLDTADVGRIARYQQRHAGAIPKRVRITRLDGKYVMAWRLKTNEVYQNPLTGAWHEKQDVEVIYEGNDKAEMPMKQFALQAEKLEAEVLQSTKDVAGNETLAIQLAEGPDKGKKLSIAVTFVN